MEVENSASDDEYEEIEEHILVEFEGALSRQFLREESSSLVISQLLDKPFMSVGPLSFEGRYEHLPHTSVIFTAPELPKTQQVRQNRLSLINCGHEGIRYRRW